MADPTMAEMTEKVESLSEALVFVEASDPLGLTNIHTGFEEIGDWADSAGEPEVAAAVLRAIAFLEGVILEEVEDAAVALEEVGAILSAIQSVVCEGRDASEVEFPTCEVSAGVSGTSGVNLPAYVDETIFSEFLNKQTGSLQEMESLILDLEKMADEEKMAALRRLIHTLKGESAILGLSDVENLCHKTEDIMNGDDATGLTDVLLNVKDWLARTFDHLAGKGESPGTSEELLAQLTGGASSGVGSAVPAELVEEDEFDDTPIPIEGDPDLLGDFIVEAMEHLDAADVHLLTLETVPEDEEALNAVFRGFHTIKGVAGFLALDDIGALAHQAENLLDKARKGDLLLEGPAIDVTFDAVDVLKRLIELVREALTAGEPMQRERSLPGLIGRIKDVAAGRVPAGAKAVTPAPPETKLGEILVESGATTEEAVEAALAEQEDRGVPPRLGEQLVRDKEAAPKDVARALRSQKPGGGKQVHVRETVKVDADRLDFMVDAIGEMVIAESMVSQSPELKGIMSQHLTRQLALLDKITRELQEMAMSLRMVPVRGTFQRMARLVRDLSKKSGKKVEFVMNGADTELDKTVVDRIGDPLVHMVRNAVDHGLEATAADREAAGKSPTGRVELRAFHKGGNIYIEIEDDGRGLDREAILSKGIERGLVKEGDTLTDSEVFGLIFEPGFSTAKKVTDVSGRGVGMDVVRRNIEALRGRTDIQSTPGKGSVFSIRLPLTLAIIDGMVVGVGGERYIVPTLSIVMSMRPEAKDITTVLNKGEMLKLQGELLPLFRLERLFKVEGATQDLTEALIVVVEADGKKAGLLTDQLLGQQQIVIKSLGESMQGLMGISGGAIMPDGRVGLILDVSGLVKLANTEDTDVPSKPKVENVESGDNEE